jgi:hypothetical protein
MAIDWNNVKSALGIIKAHANAEKKIIKEILKVGEVYDISFGGGKKGREMRELHHKIVRSGDDVNSHMDKIIELMDDALKAVSDVLKNPNSSAHVNDAKKRLVTALDEAIGSEYISASGAVNLINVANYSRINAVESELRDDVGDALLAYEELTVFIKTGYQVNEEASVEEIENTLKDKDDWVIDKLLDVIMIVETHHSRDYDFFMGMVNEYEIGGMRSRLVHPGNATNLLNDFKQFCRAYPRRPVHEVAHDIQKLVKESEGRLTTAIEKDKKKIYDKYFDACDAWFRENQDIRRVLAHRKKLWKADEEVKKPLEEFEKKVKRLITYLTEKGIFAYHGAPEDYIIFRKREDEGEVEYTIKKIREDKKKRNIEHATEMLNAILSGNEDK